MVLIDLTLETVHRYQASRLRMILRQGQLAE